MLAAADLNPVAYVVVRARLTLPQDARDPRHLVIDVQVVARRRAVARDEDRLPAQRARDQAGNQLVDRLARAVGGGRARDENGDPVAGLEGAGQGLGGGPPPGRPALGGEAGPPARGG